MTMNLGALPGPGGIRAVRRFGRAIEIHRSMLDLDRILGALLCPGAMPNPNVLVSPAADVLLLQELWEVAPLGYVAAGPTKLLRESLGKVGYEVRGTEERGWFSSPCSSGLAIASRLPILSSASMTFRASAGLQWFVPNGALHCRIELSSGLDGSPPSAAKGGAGDLRSKALRASPIPPGDREQRSCQCAAKGSPSVSRSSPSYPRCINVYTTHLHAGPLDTSFRNGPETTQAIQRAQLQELRAFIDLTCPAGEPWVVGGDMNIDGLGGAGANGLDSGTLEYGELRDLFGPSVLEAEGFPVTHPVVPRADDLVPPGSIDHIHTSEHLTLLRCNLWKGEDVVPAGDGAAGRFISDHVGVCAKFEVAGSVPSLS